MPMRASTSKPSTNSPMMRSTRQGSVWTKPGSSCRCSRPSSAWRMRCSAGPLVVTRPTRRSSSRAPRSYALLDADRLGQDAGVDVAAREHDADALARHRPGGDRGDRPAPRWARSAASSCPRRAPSPCAPRRRRRARCRRRARSAPRTCARRSARCARRRRSSTARSRGARGGPRRASAARRARRPARRRRRASPGEASRHARAAPESRPPPPIGVTTASRPGTSSSSSSVAVPCPAITFQSSNGCTSASPSRSRELARDLLAVRGIDPVGHDRGAVGRSSPRRLAALASAFMTTVTGRPAARPA